MNLIVRYTEDGPRYIDDSGAVFMLHRVDLVDQMPVRALIALLQSAPDDTYIQWDRGYDGDRDEVYAIWHAPETSEERDEREMAEVLARQKAAEKAERDRAATLTREQGALNRRRAQYEALKREFEGGA